MIRKRQDYLAEGDRSLDDPDVEGVVSIWVVGRHFQRGGRKLQGVGAVGAVAARKRLADQARGEEVVVQGQQDDGRARAAQETAHQRGVDAHQHGVGRQGVQEVSGEDIRRGRLAHLVKIVEDGLLEQTNLRATFRDYRGVSVINILANHARIDVCRQHWLTTLSG